MASAVSPPTCGVPPAPRLSAALPPVRGGGVPLLLCQHDVKGRSHEALRAPECSGDSKMETVSGVGGCEQVSVWTAKAVVGGHCQSAQCSVVRLSGHTSVVPNLWSQLWAKSLVVIAMTTIGGQNVTFRWGSRTTASPTARWRRSASGSRPPARCRSTRRISSAAGSTGTC